ncbi:MAG: hypothetical protein ACYCT2_04400 [Thermoplasmataceae archaeon]
MNPKGLSYLKWKIQVSHPEAEIDEERGTISYPIDEARILALNDSLFFATFGMLVSAILAIFAVSVAVSNRWDVDGIISAVIFFMFVILVLLFSLRFLRHVRDLKNENESWKIVLKRFFAYKREEKA